MPDAEVVEWQTRSVQDAVSASSWRFKSSPRHYSLNLFCLCKQVFNYLV